MAHRAAQTAITKPSEHRFETLALSGGKKLSVRAGRVGVSDVGLVHVNQDPITSASFGSAVDFAIPPSYLLRHLVLNLNLTPIAATFVGGTAPTITWKAGVSLYDFISRVEIWAHGGSDLIQTIQNEALDVQRELMLTPSQDAVFEATARTDGTAAAQTMYAHVATLIDQTGGFPTFAAMGDTRVRVYFKSLVEDEHYTITGAPTSYTIDTGTGIIQSFRLKMWIEDGISHADKMSLIAAHEAQPKLYRVCMPRTQPFNMGAASTGISQLLNGITGPIAMLVINLVDDVTGAEVGITSIDLKDPTGDSLVGNQPLDRKLNLLQMSSWFPSDLVATSNRYVISFASEPMKAIAHGVNSGFQTFSGAEVIEVVVPALTNASTLYVQYYQYGWLQIHKKALSVHV